MFSEPNVEMKAATVVAVSAAAAMASAAAAPAAAGSSGIDLPDVIEPQQVVINQPAFDS